jgi:serine/threonine protein phosphatase PrpC
MQLTTQSPIAERVPKRFRIGPPQDSDDFLQLFSLVLERADQEVTSGYRFEIPFAALLRLGNRNTPTLEDLSYFCQSGNSGKDWPAALQNGPAKFNRRALQPCAAKGRAASAGDNNNCQPGMFFDILQFAVDSAKRFNIDKGTQVCRVLAAVGQTLQAKDKGFSEWNRELADRHRQSARQRLGSGPLEPVQEEPQIVVKKGPPWQVEFRRKEEEGACLRLDGLVLWHASYIGPRSAEKSENQDATFAITSLEMSSPPYLVFALADGVTTSMGSRLAATSIVRRFCELVLQHMNKDEMVSASDLIEAARKTQVSLDELTKTLLSEANSYVFDAVRGSGLQRSAAARVLENTLDPRVAAMPAALMATLIGGIVQRNNILGSYQVELLRIGDGTVEHIDGGGNVTSVLETDPDVLAISESLGPGPRSRALFEQPHHLGTKTVMLGPGESLIISSDGLARGHQQLVSTKVSELLGAKFWETARPEEADAALQVLYKACHAADELFKQNTEEILFSDNVSLIIIRLGD